MPKELLSENGAGIPPRVAIGASTEEPQEPTDADLFWALYDQPIEKLPGLDAIFDKYDLPPKNLAGDVSKTGLKRFMTAARRLGLIQEPKLSLRQYIGAILP